MGELKQFPQRRVGQSLHEYRELVAARLGFDAEAADFVAASGVDLKQVAELLDCGCPHGTALRILL
jgi:hypothetical protein